jgi:hypothetical protein
MTARSDDEGTNLERAKERADLNSPFNGSFSNAQLAAEIGRCLQSQYAVPCKEPFPEELAALVRRFQEQDGANQPEQSEPDATRAEL